MSGQIVYAVEFMIFEDEGVESTLIGIYSTAEKAQAGAERWAGMERAEHAKWPGLHHDVTIVGWIDDNEPGALAPWRHAECRYEEQEISITPYLVDEGAQ